jgi:hypothetical protein
MTYLLRSPESYEQMDTHTLNTEMYFLLAVMMNESDLLNS